MNTQYQMPLLSIAIPCYNHAKFVTQTIQSVIGQDYKNIELIIIDDGSTDNSVEIIQTLVPDCERRFLRFEFRHRKNKGLSETLNEALAWCRGKYVSLLASDDIMLPNKISTQSQFLETHTDCAAVGGIAVAIDENNNLLKQRYGTVGKHYFEDIFLHKHFLIAPTAMIRLKNILAIGGYDKNIAIEDWYMWLKLTQDGAYLETLDDEVSYYRRHAYNISKNYDLMAKERNKIIDLFSFHPLYHKAKEKVKQINDGEEVKSKLGLDVNNKTQLNAILKNKFKVAAYGKGSYFDKVKSSIDIDFCDVLTTDGKQIYSENKRKIIHDFDYDLIIICSSFSPQIISLLNKHHVPLEKIKVACY